MVDGFTVVHQQQQQLQPEQQEEQEQQAQQLPTSKTIKRSTTTRRPAQRTGYCVDKYKNHFSFLRDSKFLQDLENDSVDSDIIEEELSALQQVPVSSREKAVKFLQSNPVQILLCVIVLLDALIVIAQILLDLNSVKDKLTRREEQLDNLLRYIQSHHVTRLHGYNGKDIDLVLRLLRGDPLQATDTGASSTADQQRSSSERGGTNHTETSEGGGGEGAGGGEGYKMAEMVVRGGEAHVDNDGDLLHDVAHGLHFASIALLGFLVVEDLIKIAAMGKTFFKHKIEIFDAIIIGSSFAIDIYFLRGVSGEEGPKAAAVLVILLLWRIARVVDGILVTVKQRQEFRIRLQKRARRSAEKKLEAFEEERHARTRQIEALKDLCSKAGINDADIAACAPIHGGLRGNTTLCALSSVARLSVSMTMLMSSGVYRPRLGEDGLVILATPSTPLQPSSKGGEGSKRHRHRQHTAPARTASTSTVPPGPPPLVGSAREGKGGARDEGAREEGRGEEAETLPRPFRIESLPNIIDKNENKNDDDDDEDSFSGGSGRGRGRGRGRGDLMTSSRHGKSGSSKNKSKSEEVGGSVIGGRVGEGSEAVFTSTNRTEVGVQPERSREIREERRGEVGGSSAVGGFCTVIPSNDYECIDETRHVTFTTSGPSTPRGTPSGEGEARGVSERGVEGVRGESPVNQTGVCIVISDVTRRDRDSVTSSSSSSS